MLVTERMTVQELIELLKQDDGEIPVSMILAALELATIDHCKLPKSQSYRITIDRTRLNLFGRIDPNNPIDEKEIKKFVRLWIDNNGFTHVASLLENKKWSRKKLNRETYLNFKYRALFLLEEIF